MIYITKYLIWGDIVFGKIITAMVTPFDDDDNINFDSLKSLVNHLIKNNTSTIVVSGTTGESPTLTNIEKIVLFEKTIEYAKDRVPIIAGVGSNSTQKTINFIKKVEHLPLTGYLVVVPYYNKPSQDGIFQHFEKISKCTNKPIIIYNIPSRTGVDIGFNTVKKLSEIKNIIGIKESNKDIEKIKRIKSEISNFKAYIGDDIMLYDAMMNDADGVVSVASHIYGKTINNIIQLIRIKQYDDAKAIFDIYNPKFKALFVKPNPVPIKTALNKLGINVGHVRLPLVNMKEDLKTELFSILGI